MATCDRISIGFSNEHGAGQCSEWLNRQFGCYMQKISPRPSVSLNQLLMTTPPAPLPPWNFQSLDRYMKFCKNY